MAAKVSRVVSVCTIALSALAGCARGSSSAGFDDRAPTDAVRPADAGGRDVAPPTPSHRRVFITSQTYDGDLARDALDGPLAAADARCQSAAQSECLGGAWKAWLSSNAPGAPVDAIDRIADVGPWYSVDRRTLLFRDKASLAVSPLASIHIDERGESAPFLLAWTGTASGGFAAADDCDEWGSGSTGINDGAGSIAWGRFGDGNPLGWTDSGRLTCDRRLALYCFEQ